MRRTYRKNQSGILFGEMCRIYGNLYMWVTILFALMVCVMLNVLYLQGTGVDAEAYKQRDMTLDEIAQEYEELAQYGEFRNKIRDEAKLYGQSELFQSGETDFSKRNIQKTRDDFERLPEYVLIFSGGYGLSKILHMRITDAFVVFVLFYFCLLVFLQDRKNGTLRLYVATPNGSLQLGLAKMLNLILFAVGIGIAFQIVSIGLAVFLYGSVDVSLPVQCLPGYSHCVLRINILQYLGIYAFLKCLFYITVACLFAGLVICVRNEYIAVLGMVILVGISCICYQVGAYERLSVLRHFNLISMTDTAMICRDYYNYNIGGTPVARLLMDVVVLVVVAVLAFVFSVIAFARCGAFYRDLALKRKKTEHIAEHLFPHELYKELIGRGVLWLMLSFLLVQGVLLYNRGCEWGSTDVLYKYYMQTLEGEITEEKLAYIREEREKVNQAYAMIVMYQGLVNRQQLSQSAAELAMEPYMETIKSDEALGRVEERLDYLKMLPEEAQIFIYERGYNYIFSHGREGLKKEISAALLVVIFCTVCIAGMYAEEKESGMYKLILTQRNGNRVLLKYKIGIACLIGFFASASTFIADSIYACHNFGIHNIGAISYALPALQIFGCSVGLWLVVCIALLVRVLSSCIVALVILGIERITRERFSTMLISFVVFCIPLVCLFFML